MNTPQVLHISAKMCVLSALFLVCAPLSWSEETESIELFNFEQNQIPAGVRPLDASLKLVPSAGTVRSNQALEVEFSRDISASGVEFYSDEPWNCSQLGNYRLSFEAVNTGDCSVHVFGVVRSPAGGNQRRSVCVPAHSTGTYYFELRGDGLGEDRGLRDDPPSLQGVGTKMVVQGAKFAVNFDKVKSIRLYAIDLLENKRLQIDNVRFVSNPPIDPNYMIGLVDRFGQNAKMDFEHKIRSEQQLKQLADQELEQLAKASILPDRSKFGGWKEGPRLTGTGYFRTEKNEGKWALVDPEGYLYFATGIDNSRMSNTSTFTGIALADPTRRKGNSSNSDSGSLRKAYVVSSEKRRKMFNWLPEQNDPLAKHYDYRRSSHSGPMKHGQVYSFYQANLERRYGEPSPGHFMAKWNQVTVDRMLDWGFTSLGNWADPSFYDNNRIPYFANGWVTGKFKTVSSGTDYWGPMPDPFDPEFAKQAVVSCQRVAKEVDNSPWCVGVFIDNEKSWGSPGTVRQQYGIVLHSLARDADNCPTKAEFMRILKKKYSSMNTLNQAWGTKIDSWKTLAKGVDHHSMKHSERLVADYSVLLEAYATKYFQVVHDSLAEAMPNHLYLGVRFTPWGMTPETRAAARKYCDVVSINFYREGLGDRFWDFLREYDMPCIIGEFHMGATDSGLFHPGLIIAADQKDRARMWKIYMESLVANPYFVGGHWFQYIDSPLTGRAYDGENYNVGFVTVADVPYRYMVEASKEFHRSFYKRRYGDVASTDD